MMLLTSCAPSGQNGINFCEEMQPIYVMPQDIISGRTAGEIDAYDDYGQSLCGWPRAQ